MTFRYPLGVPALFLHILRVRRRKKALFDEITQRPDPFAVAECGMIFAAFEPDFWYGGRDCSPKALFCQESRSLRHRVA